MKKLIFTLLLGLVISLAMPRCEAADVWVDHWNDENVDIYVVENSLTSQRYSDGKSFKVTTKSVRNGKLVKTIKWEYSKYLSDMWRYETNTMDGSHTTVVTPINKIFEFCMNKIGWSYRIQEYWYY